MPGKVLLNPVASVKNDENGPIEMIPVRGQQLMNSSERAGQALVSTVGMQRKHVVLGRVQLVRFDQRAVEERGEEERQLNSADIGKKSLNLHVTSSAA
jgi:hypothetical protein